MLETFALGFDKHPKNLPPLDRNLSFEEVFVDPPHTGGVLKTEIILAEGAENYPHSVFARVDFD